jgi:predicted RNA-binding Zn-ribbon protein involved in translation (DUF1610 family)
MFWKCPQCGKKSLRVEGEKAVCLACSGTNKVYPCPQCGVRALVERIPGGERHPAPRYLCFSCGGSWAAGEIETCPECGRPEFSTEFEELIICRSAAGFYVCRKCYEKIFRD